MTRPPPWWSAHVAGLILMQAAYWYGFSELHAGRPLLEALKDATLKPLSWTFCWGLPVGGFMGLWLWYICGASESPWWRWAGVVSTYALIAACWYSGAIQAAERLNYMVH